MFGWSPITIIVILIVVFLIFGAGKLPEIGSGLGKALKNFKNSVSGKDEIDVTPDSKPKKKLIPRTSSAQASAKKTKRTDSKTAKTAKKA